MRIACLQFAPQVGDVDNNLNRADAVLAKANQDDVDSLDLLVLPELAFSGYNFASCDDIEPFLEPSGSGISSLWARTVALKHNTNVLVGYPEKLDASGNSRVGPQCFNSAILVNGDGETVANYRKTFLHARDETWALEGKDFFGDAVPGLGNIALGIGADIDPYRREAPWHAFEFAFHVLDVRANLAIVTMAWLAEEDCEQFTQFPNEPDMETLTYWAQRLEPVIRDESRDELIIVFCNRSGIEGKDTVYAGTSAVIGIYQGEVKVYGLLGRGVKELLIVDTDKPPFANLTVRKSRAHLSPLEYELKTSGRVDGTDDSSSGQSLRTASNAQRQEISRTPFSNSSRPETVVAKSPELPDPAITSSRTVAAGLKTPVQSCFQTEPEADDGESVADSFDSEGHILGGSVEITFEDDHDTGNDDDDDEYVYEEHDNEVEDGPDREELPPTRAFPRVASPPPPDHELPHGIQLYRFPYEPTIMMQYPDNAEAPNTCLPQGTPKSASRTSACPSSATGVRPSRPSSPKSRNLSKARQFQQNVPEISGSEIADVVHEIPQRRTQSVAAQRREFDSPSPSWRSKSRPGRVAGLDQGLIERALDFYLTSMSIDARDRAFAAGNLLARSASRGHDEDSTRAGSTELSSLSDSASSSAQSSPTTLSEAARSQTSTPNPDKGTEQSRTMLWKDDSQIVGLQLERPNSRDDIRGRRRSRSATATNLRRSSVQSRSPSRSRAAAEQPGPAVGRISTSRFRARNGDAIRAIRDPSLGPPSDPEDEIIAEITLRRPCQNCGSGSCRLKGAGGPKVQTAQTVDGDQAVKQHDAAETTRSSKPEAEVSPSDDSEKTPTISKCRTAPEGLARLALQTSTDDLDALRAPNLSRASLRTMSSYEPSPVTPPPRRFEPRTPKAMVFTHDHGYISQTANDWDLRPNFDSVDALLDEMISTSERALPISLL